MLTRLHIRQFAIIDDLGLDFGPGMTVLSGETGAGKSILLDALGLLLGDRAGGDAVRGDAKRAEVTAEFDLTDAADASAWLAEHDLADEDDPQACLIRRILGRDGRTRGYVNGQPAAARDLRALGGLLVDIHGQHAHQMLFRGRAQQALLDDFGVDATLRGQVVELARTVQRLNQRIERLSGPDGSAGDRIDFLRYQIEELEALGPGPDELADLETEHRRLANAERLIQDGRQAMTLLYEGENGSIHDLLSQVNGLLEGLAGLDPTFAETRDLGDSAAIQIKEAADALRHTLDGLDLDPERLGWVENRLGDINDLARKHRVAPETLGERQDALRQERAELEGAGEELERLHTEREQTVRDYRTAATALSEARSEAGERMAGAVTETLRTLGMPEGRFAVQVDREDDGEPRPQGLDTITFQVSANPGQPLRPLSRVASGGELSRISLAIQVIAAGRTRIPTMVFDEVDAGIGGGVAEIVGRQLRNLGTRAQVLCVTHLPQVAAQGVQHLHVRKEIDAGQTYTRIRDLDAPARVEELARMLGGLRITDRTRAHAREMIGSAGGD